MRWLVLLLLLPTTQAFLSDPADDVRITLDGEPIGDAEGERWELHDLRGLHIEESPLAITFQINVTTLARDPNLFLADSISYVTEFRHGNASYAVHLDRNMGIGPDLEPRYSGVVERRDGVGFTYRSFDAVADEAAGTIRADVPRDALVDHEGRLPLPGHVFTDLRTEAYNPITGDDVAYGLGRALLSIAGPPPGPDETARVVDAMPDAGTVDYAIRTGLGEGDGAALSTQHPLRVSNGEATTLVFDVGLRHTAAEGRSFRLTASEVPRGWDVWFPVQDVVVEPGDGRSVPVVVQVPFAHQHGAMETFQVRAEAFEDDRFAVTRLGIHYTPVPQPAGHHDRLTLHSAESPFFIVINGVPGEEADAATDGFAWFNTLEADERDEDAPVESRPLQQADRAVIGWRMPLSPQLQMGLDLAARIGSLEVGFEAKRPVAGTFEGRVVHEAGDVQTDLMRIEGDAVAAQAMERFDVAADVVPMDIDRVPYDPEARLWLEFWIVPDQVDGFGEGVLGGAVDLLQGAIVMPLDEYHDAIDEAFSADQAIRLVADVQERRAAPGSVVVFNVMLEHRRDAPASYAFQVRGPDWFHVRAPDGSGAEGPASVPIQVVARVPEDARGRFDVLVEAADTQDDARRSIIRLVLDVAPEAEAIDEEADILDEPQGKQSPGPAIGALLALLWLAGRRRSA